MHEHDLLTDASIRPASRRKGWIAALVVAALLALLLAAGTGRRAKPYRQVARYPIAKQTRDALMTHDASRMLGALGILPCADGFCLREAEYLFVLRDWATGEERWRVTTPTPRMTATGPYRWNRAFAPAVSPDGRVLAAALADDARLRVHTWRDGRQQGEANIALSALLGNPIRSSPVMAPVMVAGLTACAMDDGRSFVTLHIAQTAYLLLIDAGGVSARYAGAGEIRLAPDGASAVVDNARLVKLAVQGATIRLTDEVWLPVDQGNWYACAGGTAVSDAGHIYRLAGQPTLPEKGWQVATITTSKRFALAYRAQQSRVLEVATGQSWTIDVPRENYSGDATEDGQHLLATFHAGVRGYIALYRHPGRLLAWMRLDQLEVNSWWPSPDGRSVALTTAQECLLYRY